MGRIRETIEQGLPDGDQIDALVGKINTLIDDWIEQGSIKATLLGWMKIEIHLPEKR